MMGTREKLMTTWEENGISFLPRCQRNSAKQSQWQFKGKLSTSKQDGSFSSPRPSQPQLTLSLRKAVIFLTFRSDVKLLNGIFSKGRKTT